MAERMSSIIKNDCALIVRVSIVNVKSSSYSMSMLEAALVILPQFLFVVILALFLLHMLRTINLLSLGLKA